MEIRSVDVGRGVGWYGDGWNGFKDNALAWVGMALVMFVIFVVLAFIPLVGSLASALLMPLFVGGLYVAARNSVEGQTVEVGQLFKMFGDEQKRGPLLVLGVLSLLVALVEGLVMAGSIGAGMGGGAMMGGPEALEHGAGAGLVFGMLIVLVISVVFFLAFVFAVPLVVFSDVAPVQALATSFKASLKNIVALAIFGIIYIPLAFVASLPLGLGFLVLIPITLIAMYVAYSEIFGVAAPAEAAATE